MRNIIRKAASVFLVGIIALVRQTQLSNIEALTSSDFSISQEGVEFICSMEGFHSTCYVDHTQSTIGYGTKCTGSPNQPHEAGTHSITREKALADMKSQINAVYAPRVRAQTRGITMNQNQFDALVSFCYNTGGGDDGISDSPLVEFLQGKLSETEARSQYSRYWVKADGKVLQGLINRRNKESDFFFSGRPICQKEWTLDGHTYRFYSGKATWSEAKKWCEDQGGYLATITSEREQKELTNRLSEYSKLYAYLGAENTSGSWKWVTGEPFEYSNWREGEPNCVGNKEFYLGILKYGEEGAHSKLWNDFSNDNPGIDGFIFESGYTPICQKEWTLDGHTYRFYSGKATWSEAKKWCEDQGGYLATITSGREQKELTNRLSEYSTLYAYLGAENTSGSWKWVTGEPFEYSNWREGEPNCVGNKEFYLGILKYGEDGDHSKLWNDFSNDNPGIDGFIFESGPVCQKEWRVFLQTYRYYSGRATWLEAKKWCEDHGGYLATITSELEQKELADKLSEYSKLYAYLGAEKTSGDWRWVTGEPFEYSNWREGEPNCVGNKEFYLGILKYGEDGAHSKLWNDFSNDNPEIDGFVFESEYTPICQKEWTIDGHTYRYYSSNLTWFEAQKWCENHGGYLATINSEREQIELAKVIKSSEWNAWLGGARGWRREVGIEWQQQWQWITGETFSYQAWRDNEPNCHDGNEFFLGTYKCSDEDPYNKLWNDFCYDSSSIHGFIFESEHE